MPVPATRALNADATDPTSRYTQVTTTNTTPGMTVARTGVPNREDRLPSRPGSAPDEDIPNPIRPSTTNPVPVPATTERATARPAARPNQVPPSTRPMYTSGAAALACKACGDTAPCSPMVHSA